MTRYIVSFGMYQYNSGAPDNGTRRCSKYFENLTAAYQFQLKLKSICKWWSDCYIMHSTKIDYNSAEHLNMEQEHKEIIETYLNYDGFLNYVDDFIMMTTTETIKLTPPFQLKEN